MVENINGNSAQEMANEFFKLINEQLMVNNDINGSIVFFDAKAYKSPKHLKTYLVSIINKADLIKVAYSRYNSIENVTEVGYQTLIYTFSCLEKKVAVKISLSGPIVVEVQHYYQGEFEDGSKDLDIIKSFSFREINYDGSTQFDLEISFTPTSLSFAVEGIVQDEFEIPEEQLDQFSIIEGISYQYWNSTYREIDKVFTIDAFDPLNYMPSIEISNALFYEESTRLISFYPNRIIGIQNWPRYCFDFDWLTEQYGDEASEVKDNPTYSLMIELKTGTKIKSDGYFNKYIDSVLSRLFSSTSFIKCFRGVLSANDYQKLFERFCTIYDQEIDVLKV